METLVFIAMAALGAAVHIGTKIRDNATQGKQTNIKKHILYGALALVFASFVALAKDELASLYPVTKVSMFMLGFALDSVMKNITNFKEPTKW